MNIGVHVDAHVNIGVHVDAHVNIGVYVDAHATLINIASARNPCYAHSRLLRVISCLLGELRFYGGFPRLLRKNTSVVEYFMMFIKLVTYHEFETVFP